MDIAANGNLTYFAEVPTLEDSSLYNPSEYFTAFFVRAATNTPAVYYDSPVDSGFSVDNLAPSIPAGFWVEYNAETGRMLRWNRSPEDDIQYYRIYCAADSNYAISSESYLKGVPDTFWLDEGIGGYKGHYYKLTAIDHSGNESKPAKPDQTTDYQGPDMPSGYALYQNIPNPFNPSTVIGFDVPPGGGVVRISIYDLKGRLIKGLCQEFRSEGRHEVLWNGDDRFGNKVNSGVYFCRLQAKQFDKTLKVVLIR